MAWLALYLYLAGIVTLTAVLDNNLNWLAILVWPLVAPVSIIVSLFKESA